MIAGFHGDSFTDDTLERFSCPTDFGARYAQKLRAAKNNRSDARKCHGFGFELGDIKSSRSKFKR